MGEPDFFVPSARASVVAAIRAIELQTSAEIVVAVRRTAGTYRQTDISLGAATAFVALLCLLFHPRDVGKPRLLAMASGSHLGDGIPLKRS